MTVSEKRKRTRAKNQGLAKRRALRIIRHTQPRTVEDLWSSGLILTEVGKRGGAFRRAYRIAGTNLVIKFPRKGWADSWEDSKKHTRDEVKKIRTLSQYRCFRHHLPPVYYYKGRDGVMVTDYYPYVNWKGASIILADVVKEFTGVELRDVVGDNDRASIILADVVKEFTGVELGDVVGDNVRAKSKLDNVVMVDCGY